MLYLCVVLLRVSICYSGFSTSSQTYTFIPASSLFVGCTGASIVTELNFVQFGEVLLVGGCAAEVAFAAVMSNGLV